MPMYLPVMAVAVAVQPQPIVLRRAEDPVIDYATVQNQVVQKAIADLRAKAKVE